MASIARDGDFKHHFWALPISLALEFFLLQNE